MRTKAVNPQKAKQFAGQTAVAILEIFSLATTIHSAPCTFADVSNTIVARVHNTGHPSIGIAAAVAKQEAATFKMARAVAIAFQKTREVNANIAGVALATRKTLKPIRKSKDQLPALIEHIDPLRTELSEALVGLRAS